MQHVRQYSDKQKILKKLIKDVVKKSTVVQKLKRLRMKYLILIVWLKTLVMMQMFKKLKIKKLISA